MSQNDDATNSELTIAAMIRTLRPTRACTKRSASSAAAAAATTALKQKNKKKRKDDDHDDGGDGDVGGSSVAPQCTPLVPEPEPSQVERWKLRSMWELASILSFLHVFRPVLNVQVEFTAEELETALITPNDTLADLHIPLLKAARPVIRMALTHDTWITVLCKKLRDRWHLVAKGELPIIASRGLEVEAYKTLDPGVRVVILKALCDIRLEQEDVRSYIDNSLKQGVQLSIFRQERVGGDSRGVSYWYEDDPLIGHRLYREIRKVEMKEVRRGKTKGSQVQSNISYQWETVATNLDEFQEVSEKLFISKNRTEALLGKRMKNDMLPEIEKIYKRKERLLKKQQREAALLDNLVHVDGLAAGRSLRDRKPVTYTFDDYDRSINEAIQITKQKPSSPESIDKKEVAFHGSSTNGICDGSPHDSPHASFSAPSPSPHDDDIDEDHNTEQLDRRSRRRQRPQRYAENDFIEDISDNEVNLDSDDDIVGEAVYDEEYRSKHKSRSKSPSSSELEGDDDYCWDDENADDEEEEEEEEDSLGLSEDTNEPRKVRKLPGRTRRGTKLREVNEIESGLRRSRRATRNHINYRQYELSNSETETEGTKPGKSNAFDEHWNTSENDDYSEGSLEAESNDEEQQMKIDEEDVVCAPDTCDGEKNEPTEEVNSPGKNEVEGVKKRRFLDLNQLAPSGFDDCPSTIRDDLNQVASESSFDYGLHTNKKDDSNQLAPGSSFDDRLSIMKDDMKKLGPEPGLESPSTVKDEDTDDF